jgi:hypothetical protein
MIDERLKMFQVEFIARANDVMHMSRACPRFSRQVRTPDQPSMVSLFFSHSVVSVSVRSSKMSTRV